MSRVCEVSGVGPMSGNKRSHSERASRRVWNVNLHNYKVTTNGVTKVVKMSARAHRTMVRANKAKPVVATAAKAAAATK